ncbi:TRAP transporter substrate-binding protein [Pseudaminobacter arsenicus]|uniref:TRAP transporter substrate-binding protein n=1 Tax=Borborobacter arsenicus TaxID=1851146 RepID=A0A432V4E8_9HYPH|nr:TRAP transporter substrate-binding protein [Pseudaminobacter arsenicus]RUM97036.1 TRAP transporter substrate-binding protein [Pseudaminobacter arsenicus]
MERRSFIKSIGLAGATVAGAALAAPAIAQDVRHWRLLHAYPKGYPVYGTAPNVFAEFVGKASGGRLKVQVYGAGEVVPAFETMDAVSSGAAQVGFGTSYFWKGKEPAMQFITGLPFGMTVQEQNAWFTAGGLELSQKVYERLGCKFFVAGNSGTQMGGWFNREIESTASFSGLKMRMPGMGGEVLSALGATIVNLPGGELLPSMQSGAIDACEWIGPYLDQAFGFHKVAKYYYYPGWQEPSGINDLFVNMDEWNKLPEDLQAIVAAGAELANAHVINELTARNPVAQKQLMDEKVEFRPFSNETLIDLANKSGEVINDLASKDPLSREVVDHILNFRAAVMGATALSEQAVLMARSLDYKYANLNGG